MNSESIEGWFWCHEKSHGRPRCAAQCAECGDLEPSDDPPSLVRAMELAGDYGTATGAFAAASTLDLAHLLDRNAAIVKEKYDALADYLRPLLAAGVDTSGKGGA